MSNERAPRGRSGPHRSGSARMGLHIEWVPRFRSLAPPGSAPAAGEREAHALACQRRTATKWVTRLCRSSSLASRKGAARRDASRGTNSSV